MAADRFLGCQQLGSQLRELLSLGWQSSPTLPKRNTDTSVKRGE